MAKNSPSRLKITSLRPRTSMSLRPPGAMSRAGATTYFAKISFPVVGSRDVRHRSAADDRLAANLLSLRLFLHKLQHIENAVARNEADAAIIGDDEIAGLDRHPTDLDRAVDLDGLEPPFSGHRVDFARPDRATTHA